MQPNPAVTDPRQTTIDTALRPPAELTPPSMLGGSSGLPDGGNDPRAATGGSTGETAAPVRSRVDIPVQRYRVVVGGHVMLDGVRVPMRVGKELDERQYDLALLRRQGVKLDLITD
jgi:hypothetical protein